MWDKRAEKWVTNFGKPQGKQISHQRMMAIAAHLRQKGLLKADDSVIDIGCGPGYYVAEFAKTACHVTGTDLSSQMVEYGICHAANIASHRVLQKCGFELEFAGMGLIQGKIQPLYRYMLTV